MSIALQERQIHPLPSDRFKGIDFKNAKLGETIGGLSFDAVEADRLAQLDVEQRRAELSKNLEGFKGEVLDDVPVSHRYHYYYDAEGNVYNHPDRHAIHRFENQFDPRERDGLPALGFKKATQLMRQNPHNTVLWYSPPGEASQDKSPHNPYAEVTFIYGQLYVMSFDGEKITGVAVKVDREGEAAIDQFMPQTFYEADKNAQSDYERIEYFLQNPTLLRCGVSEIGDYEWKNERVYGGKGEGRATQNFTVRQMLDDIKTRFTHDTYTPEINAFVQSLSSAQLEDRDEIARLYLQMILNHSKMKDTGKISLQGACGGSTVTRSDIESLLGMSAFEPLSSSSRLITQSGSLDGALRLIPNSVNQTHYEDYNCPGCKKTLSGESKTDRQSWRKKCEHCGHALQC